jgi:Mrp family chromosome partitioning ATPase
MVRHHILGHIVGCTGMWPDELERARLHVVTGKGGTGKTTVAAA